MRFFDFKFFPPFRSLTAHPLCRCRERLASNLSDQQFSPARFDHRPAVPRTLASGIVLPLDQTTSADQGFLWYLRERRENSSVGGPLGLCPRGHRQKATRAGHESLQNSPNSEHHDFRKTPILEGFFNFADESEPLNIWKQLKLFDF